MKRLPVYLRVYQAALAIICLIGIYNLFELLTKVLNKNSDFQKCLIIALGLLFCCGVLFKSYNSFSFIKHYQSNSKPTKIGLYLFYVLIILHLLITVYYTFTSIRIYELLSTIQTQTEILYLSPLTIAFLKLTVLSITSIYILIVDVLLIKCVIKNYHENFQNQIISIKL